MRGVWNEEMQEIRPRNRDNVNRAWDFAERISYESGFEFEDRRGVIHNEGVERTLAAEVGQIFIETELDIKILTFLEV